MTAATAVLKLRRRPMSSVTFCERVMRDAAHLLLRGVQLRLVELVWS